MKKVEVNNFLSKLLTNYLIYAPKKKAGKIKVSQILDKDEIDWSGDLPLNSFKVLFLPTTEELGTFNKNTFVENKNIPKQKIAWGLNILDLQAFTLFEHVFEKDVYYQKRRKNTYVVGFSNGLADDLRRYKAFHQTFKEDILEHVCFDFFIERQTNNNLLFFAGSDKGQDLLENNGIDDFENIEFAGLVPEKGINPRLSANREAVALSEKDSLWDELAEICLSCGKCSTVCPTCFCFDAFDEPGADSIIKKRRWSSCFNSEFSETAGGIKELDSIKKRLYFWYYHKFVRIPDELSYYGCVGCGRCTKVCPVGINIQKNLQILNNKNAKI
ncbi:MAG: hypothetical protein ACD_12C00672G0002 [uncultured bacterium]|nr:MAG: hypothetical protein ACD_12C00672G0002 [uncultured bacterium]KKQ79687.1 MAG: 4Fe-4S ferredoxin [Parcubacteria group bacterium GW2011_GWC2_38_7]